ncbi:type II toxin-antitoxin system PemK/MazF family toxin [Dyadobacter sp. CY326]|uniref:type II toxin-antitoxin system PemK/MazF family toxin n=1 Tax=Dyadobacter sp. CY326 TaxID=2907300 RepID=UPI001F3AF95B|nr:type II toxin-antitoxin system PemK/MazF family toxin [Dyadobacter sp. CY326]MCE7068513.1 type II toxin-antitoxin system PemK/MazF family toxin [Dyadobacter sp. CY326]
MVVKRFEIYFVNLDPTIGSEIKKSRPCVVISPDDINRSLNTVIIAPLTSTIKRYPTRVDCVVSNKSGQIAIDQLRAIDKARLFKKIGTLDATAADSVLEVIKALFA